MYNPMVHSNVGNPGSDWNSMSLYPSHSTSATLQQRINLMESNSNSHDSSYASSVGNRTEQQLNQWLRHRQEQYRTPSHMHGGLDHLGTARGLEPNGSLDRDLLSSNLATPLFGEREQDSLQQNTGALDPPPSSPYSNAEHRNF